MKKKKSQKNFVKDYILNGKQQRRLRNVRDMIHNMELSREALARLQSGTTKGEEDVDEECGYPDHVTFRMYKRMYVREGIARRVVNINPIESWSVHPWVYETEAVGHRADTPFELDWLRLQNKFNIFGKLQRLDEISGIGTYGVLLIGIDDGRTLDRPVAGINEDGEESKVRNPKKRNLLWLMPFDQGEAKIEKLQDDPESKRFGRPLYYNIEFNDPKSPKGLKGKTQLVHWSRVIHVADNCSSSDIFGTPRMQPCYNYLLNIRKTLGGSAEMFWKGGFPGIAVQSTPGSDVELDKASIEKQMTQYMKHLRRFLAGENVEFKTLAPNIEPPETHVNAQIMAVCISIDVPQRVFMGTEEARMASIMDTEMRNKKVHSRQAIHCEPNILRQLVDRFLLMQCIEPLKKKDLRGLKDNIPKDPTYIVGWPDLYAISGKDKADMTGVLVKALAEYITTGAARMFPPLQFLTMIMDFSAAQAEEIIKAAEVEAKKQDSGKSIAISPVQLAAASAQASGAAGIAKAKISKGGKPTPKSQRTPRSKNPIKPPKAGRTITRQRGK